MTRSSSHTLLRGVRLLHLYLGVFIAPALMFFAFTGALQTFSLHETTRGSSYKPPAWAVTLGQIHKKQTPVVPVRRPPPTATSDATARVAEEGAAPQHEGRRTREANPAAQSAPQAAPEVAKHHPLPLKIFFLIVSIGLFLSTLTGIYMSYKYMRNRVVVTTLLILGAVIPVVLTFV